MMSARGMDGDGVEVLDHGFVKLVEAWGSDERIIEAARMSTSKGFLGWGPVVTDETCRGCNGEGVVDDRGFVLRGQPFFDAKVCPHCDGDKKDRKPGDEKLLRYLWENKHMTPFEMAGAVFEVQAPIFVFREWHRHRTQSFNEMSARYVPLPDVNYVPSVERLMMGAGGSNKQAGTVMGAKSLTEKQAVLFRALLEEKYNGCEVTYKNALAAGVPKELARIVIPVGRYSRMRASANLRNWIQFLVLRDDEHAQWEIRQYAGAVSGILGKMFPRTMALYRESK